MPHQPCRLVHLCQSTSRLRPALRMYFSNSCLRLRVLALFTLTLLIPNVKAETLADYFPEIKGDLTQVTWAHAVNSKQKLNEALKGDTMMIEGDVILSVKDKVQGVPIMAHPPANTSDLTLEEFIDIFMESGARKGMKLDFKTRDAFSAAGTILEKMFYDKYVNFPVWLNADIVPGPVNASKAVVSPDYFLPVCISRFPFATISVGWTTRAIGNEGVYSSEVIDPMTDALNRNLVITPVTFAVRACFAARSVSNLVNLVESSVPGTTLTVWSSDPTDVIDLNGIKELVKKLGKDRVYLDMPKAEVHTVQQEDSGTTISTSSLGVTLMSLSLIYFAL